MEKAYSGLRRKRKRAHSTKCPCCYSSEDEPENHASSPKPKNADETPVIGKRTRGRKGPKVDDGDVSINSKVKENAENSQEEVGVKKNRAVVKKQMSKKTKEREKKFVNIFSMQGCNSDSEEKDVSIQSKQPGKEANKVSKKESKKNQKSAKLQQSTNKLSDERKSNDKFLNGSKGNELGKSARNESKTKASKLSLDRKRTTKEAAIVSKIDKELAEPKEKAIKKTKSKMVVSSKNEDTAGIEQKGITDSAGNVTKSKSMLKNVQPVDSVSGSPKKQKGGKGGTKHSNCKSQGNRSSSIPENPMEKKIKVFDHLFSELKKCAGHSKTTISMATELFLSITSEKLKVLMQVPVSKMSKGETVELRQAVDATLPSKAAGESNGKHSKPENAVVQATDMNDNCLSSPRKRGSTKSEEAKLSQAAEALVSFRTKPSVLRQEKPEVDVSETVLNERNDVQKSSEKKGEDVVSNDVNGNCLGSQAKVAVTQIVSTSSEARPSQTGIGFSALSQSALQSQPSQNLVFHGALSQPLNSPGNLHHVSTTQQFFTFGQLASQTSPSLTATPQIHPAVTMASSGNGPSAVVSPGVMRNPAGVQNLQALICTSPQQPPNFPISSTSQPTGTSQSVGTSKQRVSLSQPLKGMEDVVSCVGSQSAAAVLWNIKPAAPVVYITSPQTLGGVRARNIFPNEGQSILPFVTSPAKATSVVVPKTSVNLQSADLSVLAKVTRMHQSTPMSTSQTISVPTQRPILPREQKVPPSLHSGGTATTQLPVTPMVAQVPGSVQSVGPGNIALQSGNSVASLTLNSQPSTTVTTQVLNVMPQSDVSNTVALTAVNAKQAVKRFVHERTKSAEMKRTASLGSISSTDPLFIPSTSPELAENVSTLSSVQSSSVQPVTQTEQVDTSKASEFNLQQAASALLSIGSQDGLDIGDMLQPAVDGDDSLDEPDDEVVFTSKGVFRVGDVDVDPKYNRIGREGYTCGKCGKIFTSLSYLARHIKRVCPDMSCRKWKCTMCEKAFRHPFGLQQHIYTHTGERPHKCSQCPKAFYSSNDLRRHSRIHSGERPYHCKHCEKSFATTISLKTHTYIHTGEKPHKCPHCPKTFATSSKLGRHIVTHSEERPFTCNLCPKSFNRSGDLRRHNMHVHESRDKAFDWDDCEGPLGTPDYVDTHMDSTDDREENQDHNCEVSNLYPLSSTTFRSSSHLEQLMTIQDPAQALPNHRQFNQGLDVIHRGVEPVIAGGS